MSPDGLYSKTQVDQLMFLRVTVGSSALNSLVLFSDSFSHNLYSVLQGAISGRGE